MSLPEKEYLYSGHVACPGCPATLAMNYALKALGEKTVVVLAASCWSSIAGILPHSTLKVPILHVAFETAAPTAAGVKHGFEVMGKNDVTVMAWAGDGATFDIGFGPLSGAIERNDDFIYVCYDNEAYMNTGGQRSTATPLLVRTNAPPEELPKKENKKNIMEVFAAQRIPYAANVSVAFPEDFIKKMKRAKEVKGTRFIHVLSPCPTGWHFDPKLSIEIARLAVHTNIFPLLEIVDGVRFRLTVPFEGTPVEEYLRLQGRYRGLSKQQIRRIQREVDREWNRFALTRLTD